MEIIKYSIITLGIGIGLYLIWKLVKAIYYHNIRRFRERQLDTSGQSICIHTPDGNIIRVPLKPQHDLTTFRAD